MSFSHLISIFKMFSLDTVLAVLTVYKTGQNPKARLVVSRGPWGLGAAGWLGALRPAWCHTHAPVPPVPSPRSEWPQAGDPAQDLAELLLRLFSSRQPWPRCLFLPVECGGLGQKAGVNGTASKRR